ncbi:hypothetical protein ACFLU4_01825 [Chloroflexota bacterium]
MAESQYPRRFINQYAKIPPQVSAKVEAECGAEYEGVRHCLGLIITNLLVYGTVAYSRRGNFYSENRTRHYTRANMLRAADIAAEREYATKKSGFRSAGYSRGVSSSLSALPRLSHEFAPLNGIELDLKALPLLTINGRPIFDIDCVKSFKPVSGVPIPHLPTTYDAIFKLKGVFQQDEHRLP